MQTYAPEKKVQQPRSERHRSWLPVLGPASVVALIALGIWALVGSSDLTSEQQAMVDSVEEYFAAVNDGDVDALSTYFTSDARLVHDADEAPL